MELYTLLALFVGAFAGTAVFGHYLIPYLCRRRAGQPILQIGPSWHNSKRGTPTLGGLAFIGAILLTVLLWALFLLMRGGNGALRAPALILAYAVLCGAIGFFDDLRKLQKKENQGLTAPEKYLLQLLASSLFLFGARALLGVNTAILLPFSGGTLELGFFYYPLALLYLTGLVNALNLTDGVDGLLSTLVAVFSCFAILWGYRARVEVSVGIGVLLLGGTLGFLLYNAHPAKVFMGDTGSLFLGGAVAALGIVTKHPLAVLLASGVFVAEAASVILQVVYFRLSGGKRLFRMAPLHHHFEKGGWSEWRVVAVFAAAGILLGAIAFWGVSV